MLHKARKRIPGAWPLLAAVTITGLTLTGCATKGYVRSQVGDLRQEVTSLRSDVEDAKSIADQAVSGAEEAKSSAQAAHDLALGNVGLREANRFRVQFAFDSARLDGGAEAVLEQAAREIESHPGYMVQILGFTDPTGPESYNLQLGQRRADSVLRYLANRTPLDLVRLRAFSFGETPPDSEAGGLGETEQRRQVSVVLVERIPKGVEGSISQRP